jgi:hypothetical protein
MDDRPEVDTPVSTIRVRGQTSVSRRAWPGARSDAPQIAIPDILDALLPEEVASFLRRNRGVIAVIAIVGVLTELLADAPWLLIIPALAGIAALHLAPRIPFTFAAGLIGRLGARRPRRPAS